MGEAIYIGIYGSSGKRNCKQSIEESVRKSKRKETVGKVLENHRM
jgi:hypothetical protein